MLKLIFVRGRQMRAHGTVMAGDDDAAAAGRLVRRDKVLGADAGFFVLGT